MLNSKLTHAGLAWFLAVMAAPAWAQTDKDPGFGKHPAYSVTTIRPDSFHPQVCGMDFLPDGRMVLVTWKGSSTPMWQSNGGKWGQVYIVDGFDGPDRNAIKVTKVADGFKDAMGVAVVQGEIYVGDVDRIVKLTNKDANGVYQGKQEIGKFPSSPDGWFEYSFGPVFKDGKFYMSLAVTVDGSGWNVTQKSSDRSTVISFPLAGGAYTVVASGFRAPDGIGLGPEGELFVTDNQGGWLPTNKIIHVVPGRFYGYMATPPSKFQNLPMTQPTLWLPYREAISHSPTELHAMTAGPFKGHMIYGDVSRGGLYRAYLEKVRDPVTGQEEYQGCVFPFTGGLESGTHRLKIAPNGDVYVGGLGNGEETNKGWLGTEYGLQRISAIPGASAFEMFAVHARKGGMEIEFTKPAGASAELAANYKAKTWNYIPEAGYGFGKQPVANLTVSSVQISPDRKRVFLAINGIKDKGFVVDLVASNIKSQTGEDLLYKETWYTMRALSQSEPFSPTKVREGDKDRGAADAGRRPGFQAYRTGPGSLRVRLPAHGGYSVQVSEMTGKILASGSGLFGLAEFHFPPRSTGLLMVRISGLGDTQVRTIAF